MAIEDSQALMGRAAYTVEEFCAAYRISRSRLYQYWSAGTGPRFFRNGNRKLVTLESAVEWLRDREAAATRTTSSRSSDPSNGPKRDARIPH
jgi:hypothetical protein